MNDRPNKVLDFLAANGPCGRQYIVAGLEAVMDVDVVDAGLSRLKRKGRLRQDAEGRYEIVGAYSPAPANPGIRSEARAWRDFPLGAERGAIRFSLPLGGITGAEARRFAAHVATFAADFEVEDERVGD